MPSRESKKGFQKVVIKDGEILLTGLPCKKGENIEMIFLLLNRPSKKPRLTARKLLELNLIGAWKRRTDIKDSYSYARQLRALCLNLGGELGD
jgi:hypothetical protein